MPNSTISASCSNLASSSLVNHADYSYFKACKKGRVTLSNATKLLNKIENSNSKLSSFEYKEIVLNLKGIEGVLPAKKNKTYQQTSHLLNKCQEKIKAQCSYEAKNALLNEARHKAEDEIEVALSSVEKDIPKLEQTVRDCKFKVFNLVMQLPTHIQPEARRYLDQQNYEPFVEDSNVAKEFFPQKVSWIQMGNKKTKHYEDDKELPIWTALGKEGPLLSHAKENLSCARAIIDDSEDLKTVVAIKFDNILLTDNQRAMLAFARKLK